MYVADCTARLLRVSDREKEKGKKRKNDRTRTHAQRTHTGLRHDGAVGCAEVDGAGRGGQRRRAVGPVVRQREVGRESDPVEGQPRGRVQQHRHKRKRQCSRSSGHRLCEGLERSKRRHGDEAHKMFAGSPELFSSFCRFFRSFFFFSFASCLQPLLELTMLAACLLLFAVGALAQDVTQTPIPQVSVSAAEFASFAHDVGAMEGAKIECSARGNAGAAGAAA
jgi:hypothetical protein